jgi:hypothetical protein
VIWCGSSAESRAKRRARYKRILLGSSGGIWLKKKTKADFFLVGKECVTKKFALL